MSITIYPPSAYVKKDQLIKAWINFKGTGSIAIRDSFNVSSITDNGTGNYTVTWDIDFANTNYSVVVTGGLGLYASVWVMNTTDVTVIIFNAGASADSDVVLVMAIGDQ